MEGGLDDDERVQIGRLNGKFVPSSGVDDYRYRPPVYSHLSLFEWIQSSEKKKRTEKERARFEEEVRLSHHYKSDYKKAAAKRFREDGGDSLDGEDPLEDELEFPDDESDFCSSGLNHEDRDDVSDWETDDDDDVIIAKQDAIDKSKRVTWHAFATEHGQFPTHAVTCHLSRLADYIPNFIGGSIPRSDKGDRAAYCMTMLTLFQPWRAPLDLKSADATWDQAFRAYNFSERQLELIRNFDVRYECNDARDDHFALMRKKLADAKASGQSLLPAGFLGYKDKFADDLNEFDYGSDDGDADDGDEFEERGRRTARMMAEALDMKRIMETSGWLD
ncbi:hypothetical protein C8R46DRAFT_913244, partial [Mycena filopes]